MAFHIQIVSEKAKNWTKTGKTPPKKVVFPAPPISWLSLSEKGTRPFPDTNKYQKYKSVVLGDQLNAVMSLLTMISMMTKITQIT